MVVSEIQAFCGNDDCRAVMWNPQDTATAFWATAQPVKLIRDDQSDGTPA